MKIPSLFAAVLALAASVSAITPVSPPPADQSQKTGQSQQVTPTVDVCFVLDTTGSMSGLIEAAKQKIWHIANQIASRKPTPKIRFALIGYRDRGDDYVTSVNQLTDDLDGIYGALLQFRADGGGDGPESVNQALHEAVTGLKWDRGQDTKRIIFLVGDAPPHMDYANDTPYMATCQLAARRGIVINTLQCGNMAETPVHWSAIAKLGGGRYVRIPQNGGARDIQTPHDGEIQELTRKLNGTVIPYGDPSRQAVVKEKVMNSSVGKAEQQAARAACIAKNGEGRVVTGDDDLVDAVNRGVVPLEKVQQEYLPAEMKKLDAAGLKAAIETRQAERAGLQKKLAELGHLRDEFIAKAESLKTTGEKSAFDANIAEMLDTQLAR